MMFWYGDDVSGWGWFAMVTSMILFWALIIAAGVLLFRALRRTTEQPQPPAAQSAERLLAERFARGDIDEEEYRRRLAALHSPGPPTKP